MADYIIKIIIIITTIWVFIRDWRKVRRKDRMTGRRGKRRKQLLDDLKEKRKYWKLKEEALDRTLWRTRFVRGYGRVVRQSTEWISIYTTVTYFRLVRLQESSQTTGRNPTTALLNCAGSPSMQRDCTHAATLGQHHGTRDQQVGFPKIQDACLWGNKDALHEAPVAAVGCWEALAVSLRYSGRQVVGPVAGKPTLRTKRTAGIWELREYLCWRFGVLAGARGEFMAGPAAAGNYIRPSDGR